MGSPKELIEEELKAHADNDADNQWYRSHLPGEGPQHRVRITKPYRLGVTEVTQEEYQRVVGSNPSHFQGDLKRPVEQVSWDDAVEFCRKLSELPEEKGAKRRYGLPTAAQWEYACRAGNPGRWCFGNDEGRLGEFCWFAANSGDQTHPVGQKRANAFGLYDMHGNVWEWCEDWWGSDYYLASPPEDPNGPSSGASRVLRGGSWMSWPSVVRSAYRFRIAPGNRFSYNGFRVSRTP